jgi:hypothetical protein
MLAWKALEKAISSNWVLTINQYPLP